MGSFFMYGNLIVGVLILLIGFKVYNPFKGKNDEEAETNFYDKYGTLLKIGGVLLIILSLFKIYFSQIQSPKWTDQDKGYMIDQCVKYAREKVANEERVANYCECTAKTTMLRLDKKTYLMYQQLPPDEFQHKIDPIIALCNSDFIDS